MIDMLDFRKKVEDSIENKTGVLFKNFFDEESTPNWSDILYCLHQESQAEADKDFSGGEKPYGNVLLSKNLYLTSHLERPEIRKYFPKMVKTMDSISEKSGVIMSAIGPKVCIGPHNVNVHVDNWHAFALQCEGKAKWILSDTEDRTGGYIEEFYPERGDMLFFPKGVWHTIETQDFPRGGIQFNAELVPIK
jgi:hypothetical protein